MKMRSEVFFLFFLLCAGCASAPPPPLLSGTPSENMVLCFSNSSEIPSIVEKFLVSRDLATEESKIDYLLNRVRDAHVVFVRNREKYTSQSASEFLRWKLDRLRGAHHMQINTAQDFVTQVSAGSRVSGEPYLVIFRDGSRYPLREILQNELDQLELCLKLKTTEVPTQPSSASATTPPSEPAKVNAAQ